MTKALRWIDKDATSRAAVDGRDIVNEVFVQQFKIYGASVLSTICLVILNMISGADCSDDLQVNNGWKTKWQGVGVSPRDHGAHETLFLVSL
jgi:hypothetical protein